MKRLALITVGAMAIAVVVLRISQDKYDTRTVSLGGKTVTALVADTPERRATGLGGRRSLDANEGMIFFFDTDAQYGFWMKGMKFPIDIIWIDDGKIVDIAPSVQPPASEDGELQSYLPRLPADTVLEVNSGFTQANGVKIGDEVSVAGS